MQGRVKSRPGKWVSVGPGSSSPHSQSRLAGFAHPAVRLWGWDTCKACCLSPICFPGAALPSEAHCMRDTHLGAAFPSWECSPGPTRERVAMTIVAYCSPAPFCHGKSPVRNQHSPGFPGCLDFSTGGGRGRFSPSVPRGDGMKARTTASKQTPQFPQLLGDIKKSTPLQRGQSTVVVVAMFVERKGVGDIRRRRGHFSGWGRGARTRR